MLMQIHLGWWGKWKLHDAKQKSRLSFEHSLF